VQIEHWLPFVADGGEETKIFVFSRRKEPELPVGKIGKVCFWGELFENIF
jgi:hypothetical protein